MTAQRNNSSGQILISILIAMAVFAILAHALFTLIGTTYQQISYNRARTAAKHLAAQEMEIIRNLKYDDIGTQGGIPSGSLPQTKTIAANGLTYTVKTAIIYIDDPFDGVDFSTGDYKRVRVEISWGGVSPSNKGPVVLITDIAPQLGTVSSTAGTLKIVVVDANNTAVSGASVHIVADSITPAVDLTQVTGASGIITLPGAQPCTNCYQISVTKTGYSSERTYSSSEVANPLKSHASILVSDLTQISFAIDQLGSIEVSSTDSRENSFQPKASVPFRIHGDKIIGMNADGKVVYKYDKSITTDGNGHYSFPNIEWGIYTITMPAATVYDIAGSTPLLPLNLTPGGNISLTFSVKAHTDHSTLAIVKNPSQSLLENVNLRLYDDSGFSEATTSGKTTDPDWGQNLFSNLNDTITYHLEATASGFINKTKDIYVSGYSVDEIILTPE